MFIVKSFFSLQLICRVSVCAIKNCANVNSQWKKSSPLDLEIKVKYIGKFSSCRLYSKELINMDLSKVLQQYQFHLSAYDVIS